jgi:hypothetical protein
MPTNNDDTNENMTALTRGDLEQILDQRLANYPTKQELEIAIENGLKNGSWRWRCSRRRLVLAAGNRASV